MNKTICSLLVSLALLGCSSPAKKTYFYTLDKQTTQSELIKSEATTQLVVLDEIALADYLRQQGIIVKESRSRLQVSANHRWAESLDGALARHLRGELADGLSIYSKPRTLTVIITTRCVSEGSKVSLAHAAGYYIDKPPSDSQS